MLDMLTNELIQFSQTNDENPTDWLHQRAWVEINLSALASNIRGIKSCLNPQTQLMAIVKADAYGHGATTVAYTVLQHGASWLGVATIPEGIELRKAGISAPILILGATYSPDQIKAIAHWNLQPTLCSSEQVLVFTHTLAQINITVPVHIKIDTGMSRLGICWENAPEFVQLVERSPHLQIASIYSHFATADSEDPTIMNLQHQRFKKAIEQIKSLGVKIPFLHLANSAATLTDKSLHYDLVRVGLSMYGYLPSPHLKTHNSPILKPVLEVKARITQIKEISQGTGISYGHHFIAPKNMRIAIVGIGYADGIPRNLSGKMQVILHNQLVRQLGSITMDQIMIDVTNIPNVKTGDIVTILGQEGNIEISADTWADILGTISWEILCGFKHRLPRISINN